MASSMDVRGFISALHEDMDRVTDIVRDDMEDSNSFVMGMIPDMGDITDNTQTDSFEYTAAKPGYLAYNNRDHSPRALVPGSMEAQGLNGNYTDFDTNVNEKDPNACDGGIAVFRYGQGFKRYSSEDYERPLETPIYCANDYLRMGDDHVDGFIEGLFESYRKYGVNNFEAELQNRVIEFGEANGSITAGKFELSKGGWSKEPTSRMTIHYLTEYRNYMDFEDALDEDGFLKVEMPRLDWFDAVTEHQVRKHGMGGLANFDKGILRDDKAELYNREYHEYENIRCYFNERPVRGYFRPDGVHPVTNEVQLSFVRIFPWVNVVNEIGGVSAEPNHRYNQATISVDGSTYNVVTLAFHIHQSSFQRFRIKESHHKPVGDAVVPTNFSMTVLDGPWIENNKMNTKFQLVSNHAYRLKVKKAERSGAIAYRHSRPSGYIIAPTSGDDLTKPDANLRPQEFEKCAPDAGSIANCATADMIVNDNHDCVPDPSPTVLSMVPSGGVVQHLNGRAAATVTLEVKRSGVFDKEATVDYALTAISGAVAGTHYTDANGTLTFAPNETSKQISVAILTGEGLDNIDDGVKVTLSNPGGAANPTLEDTFVDIRIIDTLA